MMYCILNLYAYPGFLEYVYHNLNFLNVSGHPLKHNCIMFVLITDGDVEVQK